MIYQLFNHDTRTLEWTASMSSIEEWVAGLQKKGVSFLAVESGLGKSVDYLTKREIGPQWTNYQEYDDWKNGRKKYEPGPLVPLFARFLRPNSLVLFHAIMGPELARLDCIYRNKSRYGPVFSGSLWTLDAEGKDFYQWNFNDKQVEPLSITPEMLAYLGIVVRDDSDELQLTPLVAGKYDRQAQTITVPFVPRVIRWVHELQYLMNLISEK